MKREELLRAFKEVRKTSVDLCRPLVTEDYVVQTMVDVSPPKWNLAHTTWFFERVILQKYVTGYTPYNELYYTLFNSYYQSLGDRWNRDIRGTISRPTVDEVYRYRDEINDRMIGLIQGADAGRYDEVARLTELGIHHEQQHQELMLTDVKHILASNPLHPVYAPSNSRVAGRQVPAPEYIPVEGGEFSIGAGENGFSWDNERPKHRILLQDFAIMSRLVTCGEFREFMDDGGYENALLWLSDAWEIVRNEQWKAPLYWEKKDDTWQIGTLNGLREVDPSEPVCHVSYYEAMAYAQWAGRRIPLEGEWEKASTLLASGHPCGNFMEHRVFHPVPLGDVPGSAVGGLSQMFGDVWEWTGSAYLPYPGYRPEAGPLGEYNGKFMNNQMVLRGGSCATPSGHIRNTYRNFFQGDKRWQFTGIRLASDGQ